MIFSRKQLDQLAGTNGYSINTLISEQKKLKSYQNKRISLQKQMREVLSSKQGDLPSGSSLLMGRINTELLKQYGFGSIDELIADYEQNDKDIENVKNKVIKEDNKIKSSLDVLKDVDITKDMKTQVTQEVLLDSDLAEVRNNSQEILLMLSQSKTSDEVLSVAKNQIDSNELKIANFINANRLNSLNMLKQSESDIRKGNILGQSISDRLQKMSVQKKEETYLDNLNSKISELSPTVKNVLLLSTFGAFFGLGISATINSGKHTKNSRKEEKGKDDG